MMLSHPSASSPHKHHHHAAPSAPSHPRSRHKLKAEKRAKSDDPKATPKVEPPPWTAVSEGALPLNPFWFADEHWFPQLPSVHPDTVPHSISAPQTSSSPSTELKNEHSSHRTHRKSAPPTPATAIASHRAPAQASATTRAHSKSAPPVASPSRVVLQPSRSDPSLKSTALRLDDVKVKRQQYALSPRHWRRATAIVPSRSEPALTRTEPSPFRLLPVSSAGTIPRARSSPSTTAAPPRSYHSAPLQRRHRVTSRPTTPPLTSTALTTTTINKSPLSSPRAQAHERRRRFSLTHHVGGADLGSPHLTLYRTHQALVPRVRFSSYPPEIDDRAEEKAEERERKKRSDEKALVWDQLDAKWRRPLAQCSVAQDLPRFIGRLQVRESGSTIWSCPDDAPPLESIRSLLLLLMRKLSVVLGPEAERTFDELFDAYQTANPTTVLDQFFASCLPHDSPLLSLLKVCASQGFVAPVWLWLRMSVLIGIAFKDVPRGWRIRIDFDPEQHELTVLHAKEEQERVPEGHLPSFKFTWELRATFGIKMRDMRHAIFGITALSFNHIPPGKRTLIDLVRRKAGTALIPPQADEQGEEKGEEEGE